jgi:hypothetical protein
VRSRQAGSPGSNYHDIDCVIFRHKLIMSRVGSEKR